MFILPSHPPCDTCEERPGEYRTHGPNGPTGWICDPCADDAFERYSSDLNAVSWRERAELDARAPQ